ncbi:hypothetical protein N9S04_00035 [bacterium]|nr:hypothetical protein [bacterium]|tara:strand:- start:1022 stop:2200 length:1179 start_codon:yes stop_codon:yes gene_type:complete
MSILTPQQVRNFSDRLSSRADLFQEAFIDSVYSGLPQVFDAIVLSDNDPPDSVGTKIQVGDTTYVILRIRPIGIHNLIYPDPFLPSCADISNKLINLHPQCVIEMPENTTIPSSGDVIECRLMKEGNSQRSVILSTKIKTRVPGQRTVQQQRKAAQAAFLGQAPVTIGNLGLPTLEGDLTPISTWAATNSQKEDGAFSKGQCPSALTGVFKELPRKTTTFYKYSRENVVNAIASTSEKDFVKKTMYVFIRKEQGKFNFPNNNVAGIQTDGPMFAGTNLSDYDYQTCFRDSGNVYRAFAGFNSLEKGMAVFGKQIAAKYRGRWTALNGTNQQQAEQLVRNYYTRPGWNLALTEAEYQILKSTGKVTRGSTVIERNIQVDVKNFKKYILEFGAQ